MFPLRKCRYDLIRVPRGHFINYAFSWTPVFSVLMGFDGQVLYYFSCTLWANGLQDGLLNAPYILKQFNLYVLFLLLWASFFIFYFCKGEYTTSKPEVWLWQRVRGHSSYCRVLERNLRDLFPQSHETQATDDESLFCCLCSLGLIVREAGLTNVIKRWTIH